MQESIVGSQFTGSYRCADDGKIVPSITGRAWICADTELVFQSDDPVCERNCLTSSFVGAGVIGIACAHYLCESGYRVKVIEQDRIGSACSKANCGYICPSHVLPLTEPGAVSAGLRSIFNPHAAFRFRPQARLSLYRWLWEFAQHCNRSQMLDASHHLHAILEFSAAEYRKLLAERMFDGEWHDNGLLYVFASQRGFDAFARTDALLSDLHGLKAKRIDGTALPDFDAALKSGLAGGFYYRDDASLHPDTFVSRWAEATRHRGVEYVEQCRLDDVEKTAGSVTALLTSQGKLRADYYVIATGAWSGKLGKLLDCQLPVEPGKGYSVTMNRPDTVPTHPMLFPEHRVGMTPFDKTYRLGSMMEFAGFDTTIPEHRIRQLQESAEPYLTHPIGSEILETWYGWRPMTWDSLPIVGRAPSYTNVLLATGHNMLGLTLAPGTGRIIGGSCRRSSAGYSCQRVYARTFLIGF